MESLVFDVAADVTVYFSREILEEIVVEWLRRFSLEKWFLEVLAGDHKPERNGRELFDLN
jgi:hypothetical protein